MATIEKRQADRDRFLLRLYHHSGGDQQAFFAEDEIAQEVGLSRPESDLVTQQLRARGSINFMGGRQVGITPFGVEEAERLLLQMREAESSVLQAALDTPEFRTGDEELDRLLQTARTKFRERSAEVRVEALEKLWDGWERLKTLRNADKKKGIRLLLDEAIPEPNLRARVEAEAEELTSIGNRFMIRHTETDRIRISRSAEVDYLFHRMFALIWLLLTARAAPAR